MRLMSLSAAILLGLPLLAAPAFAAPFDGRWIAEMPPEPGPGCGAAVMSVTVVGDTVIGRDSQPQLPCSAARWKRTARGTYLVRARHRHYPLQRRSFRSQLHHAQMRPAHVLGDRAPSDADNARMAAERQQKQIRFAELTRAADWPATRWIIRALRALYPYTEYWDPYGNRTDALVRQADAAAKGGDCTQAMALLDQTLKYDFTLDSAHALRADCLKAGDPRRAAIEDGIANGLIRSLMQSGDGNSEADRLCGEHGAGRARRAGQPPASSSRPRRPKSAAATAIIMSFWTAFRSRTGSRCARFTSMSVLSSPGG